jgi:hypothetical protein
MEPAAAAACITLIASCRCRPVPSATATSVIAQTTNASDMRDGAGAIASGGAMEDSGGLRIWVVDPKLIRVEFQPLSLLGATQRDRA